MAEVPQEILRARRTAALARGTLALCGLGAVIGNPGLVTSPALALIGFGCIVATALVELAAPRASWLVLEESVGGITAILIIGLGPERVSILSLLWLAAVASGVLARGGRMFWVGRALLLLALALPVVREREASFAYLALVLAALALLLTCGRVTRELRGMLERARYDADHDSLTGALSLAAFRAGLDQLAGPASTAEIAVLLVDVDGFGTINKTSGHRAGDAALIALVDQARAAAGDAHLIGRLGGDEFALAVHDPDPITLGRRLLAALSEPGDGRLALDACIGIARMPSDGCDAESVLRAVDVALRVAKRTGRRQVSLYAAGRSPQAAAGREPISSG